MNATDITAIASVIVVTVSSLVIPWWLRWRRRNDDLDRNELLNWTLLNRSITKERDNLRARLDEIDQHYVARVKALEADWQAQLQAAQSRIRDLEQQVGVLQRLLQQGQSSGLPSQDLP